MLGLPAATELSQQLHKKAIYAKFNMNSAAKDKFDADISKIVIVNEISPLTIAVAVGESVNSVYVLKVTLKHKDYDEQNIIKLSRLINQNLIMILEYTGESRLAVVYMNKLLCTDFRPSGMLKLELKGLDFDEVWKNIIIQIGGIEITNDRTLEEQIAEDERVNKLKKEIEKLERMAQKEIQPKKKFELHQKILRLKKEI